jgi:hypothetical protein
MTIENKTKQLKTNLAIKLCNKDHFSKVTLGDNKKNYKNLFDQLCLSLFLLVKFLKSFIPT